ncbi:MAG: DUF167 domain-containing protein [Candidatus Pacebacteria bacterium]|nr:DUF167 domain-containing protein [Candidatus Paceibacterota bacterium]
MKRINITVNSNAKNNSVISLGDDNYKINVTTTPESGKANKKVIELLADFLKIKKSQITISKGHKNKNKVIEISG